MQFIAKIWKNIKSSFNCRLCWRVTFSVFFAILIVEAAILLFSIQNYERDRLAEVEREAIVVMRSILRSSVSEGSISMELMENGEKLRTNTVLVGAEIYASEGQKVTHFGDLPDATSVSSLNPRHMMNSGVSMDVLWQMDQFQQPYSVVARIDTSEIDSQITAFIWRIIGLVVLISLFVTIVTMVVLERLVLSPIRELRNSLLDAGRDPENSKGYILASDRSDELGDVVKAFNQMLQQTSKNFGHIKKQGKELEAHRDKLELLVKERTAKLEASTKLAEAANKAKTNFLAHMSHELRTPLNAIIGFSQMWKDQVLGPVENQTYLEYASDINNAGNQLLQIISGILDLTKIESSEIELELLDVDLETSLSAYVAILKQASEEKNIKFQTHIAPELTSMKIDAQLFKQIFINLLGNAIKFSPNDGVIDITANHHADGCIIISVADSGIGIDPKDILMIQEPFGQVRHNSHVSHEGAGIGLPLAKKLIELHSGKLEIISELGKGTTVNVIFPA